MLTLLTRKLCPLLSLAVVTIGCGKKINEGKGSSANQTTQNQERPSTYILRLDGRTETSKQYKTPQYVRRFQIPEELVVRSGNPQGVEVQVAYQVDEEYDDFYNYRCNYIASANPTRMVLKECVDIDDYNYGDVSNQWFSLDQDEIIQLKFVNDKSNNVVVDIIYNMEWF